MPAAFRFVLLQFPLGYADESEETMLRTIVTTLLMIEGGIFLSAGMAPGVKEFLQSTLSGYPDLIPPEQLGELMALFGWLQRIAIGFGLLCVVGGWGAMQRSAWGRWTALAASIGNLALILPLGIAGLVVFVPGEPKQASESGEKKSPQTAAERPQPVSHVLVMIASLGLVVYLSHWIRKFAVAQGLPADPAEELGLAWILVGQLVFTLFHEIGHLVAAWAVGFRFHEISVGPFKLSERPGGSWALRFNFQGLLMAGGYLQAVPRTVKDLRMNWILVVIAGPAASMFTALIGFLMLISIAGTPYAGYWDWAAFVTAICTADCIANLLPLGLTDGALLIHTAMGTKRGKGILAGLEAAMLNDRVDRSEGLVDPVELLAARRQALAHLEKNSEVSELTLAAQRIEFAQASLRNGQAEQAAEALQEAGKTLEKLQGVPNVIWFRYWADTYETATARKQYTFAAGARQKALEYGDRLDGEKLDWEELVLIRLGCARLLMSDGDHPAAILKIQETRAACPARRSLTAHAAELLAVEGECELRLGRQEAGSTLTKAAIEIAQALPTGQKALAMELLAHTAVRLSAAGDYSFAQPLFEAAVTGIETSPAAGTVSAGYRTAWAEALYENGNLAESKAILKPLHSAAFGFSADIETLRAQLLLAEDRPQEAVEVLNPVLEPAMDDPDERRLVVLARSRALRSWAHFRSGALAEAVADARSACDILMPLEHPDAAPALLTLALSVEGENADLAEAYLQESSRLIFESTILSPLAKASRLKDLARSVVQVQKKDWGKRLLDQAVQARGQEVRGNGQARSASVAEAAV